jgi:hypothetical protein
MSKSKIIFIFIVLLVVGYAVFDYQWESKKNTEKDQKSLLINKKPDEFSAILIKSGTEQVSLKNTAEGWFFDQNLSEKADQQAVQDFIEGLVREKSKEIAVEGEKFDEKIFGFDQSLAHFEFQFKDGQKIDFQLAGKKNFQGDAFLKRQNENKVLIASSVWFSKAERKIYDFRDKRWARIDSAEIEKLKVLKAKQEISFVKSNDKWISEKYPQYILDQNQVRKLVNAFTSNQVQKFDAVADSKPLVSINLELKGGKRWLGQLGINKDKSHFLVFDDPKSVVQISQADAEPFLTLTVDSVRDRKLPFVVKAREIKKIEFSEVDKKTEFTLSTDKWVSDTNKDLNQEKMKQIVQNFENLEVKDFTDKTQLPSAAKNLRRYILKGEGDKVLLQLDLVPEKEHFLVKSSLFEQLITLDKTRVDSIHFVDVEEKK